MLAHDKAQSHEGRSAPRTQLRRPTQFMFIDSSNGGVNAKPDKNVRSFVMKSARHKKMWSTRPKSPRTNASSDEKPRRRSSIQTNNSTEHRASLDNLSRLNCCTPADTHSHTSPNSAKSDSVFSFNSTDYSWDSFGSCSTSPCMEYQQAEDAYSLSHLPQMLLPYRYTFDKGTLGSFDCLAVALDVNAESLLRQFIEAAAPRLIPIDPYRSSENAAMHWIKDSIQSPIGAPFIYAVLNSSARAAQLDPEAYKWLAISAVNRLLSNPRTSTKDTTIAAVLVLLANEEADLADPKRRGDERECSLMVNDAHHNGLRTMIQQRGGLAALSGNRVLQVCLLMHSIAQTITTFRQPYAVLVDVNGQIEDYATTTTQPPSAFASILHPFRALNIDRSLLKIIFAITIFTTDLTKWYTDGICPTDSLDLQKHASLLLYRLFDWYQHSSQPNTNGYPSTTTVDQSICLALLIFMVNATEPNAGSVGRRLSKTVVRLRQSLRQVPMYRWSTAPDLFFWVLTMGALAAKSQHRAVGGESIASFFKEHMQLAFAGGGVGSTDRLLDMVRTGLWIPTVFDERVKVLWVSMGLYGACVVDVEDVSSSEGEQGEDEYALGQSTTLRFFTADKSRL